MGLHTKFTSTIDQTLEKAEMRMVRWMCRTSLHEGIKNEVLLQSVGLMGVAEVIRIGRLRWYGHVARREDIHWLQKDLNFPVPERKI